MAKFLYLRLSIGQKIRVHWNFWAQKEFAEQTGKDLNCFLNDTFSVNDVIIFAYIAAKCGEREDGRDLGLTKEQFGRILDTATIFEFSKLVPELALIPISSN